MLQRIQTVYLFIGTVLSIAILMSGLVLVQQEDLYAILGVMGVKSGSLVFDFLSPYPLAVLAGIMVGLQGFALSQFKNRKLQMKLVRINFIVAIVYAAYLSYLCYDIYVSELVMQPLPSAFHIVLILFANLLALRGINKDEKLVKSVDRIR